MQDKSQVSLGDLEEQLVRIKYKVRRWKQLSPWRHGLERIVEKQSVRNESLFVLVLDSLKMFGSEMLFSSTHFFNILNWQVFVRSGYKNRLEQPISVGAVCGLLVVIITAAW